MLASTAVVASSTLRPRIACGTGSRSPTAGTAVGGAVLVVRDGFGGCDLRRGLSPLARARGHDGVEASLPAKALVVLPVVLPWTVLGVVARGSLGSATKEEWSWAEKPTLRGKLLGGGAPQKPS